MKKRVIVLVALLLIVLGSMSYASGRYVTGRYWQGPLQFYKDQTPVSIGVDPIIINGTTYVPVRAMSQLLGMTVNWNGQDRSIRITSDQTQQANLSYYTDQLSKAQNDLKKAKKDLEDQKKDYEEKLEKLKKEKNDLQKKYDDLLKTGNYRYSGWYGYGYNYGDIQSALNNNESRPTVDGKTVSASYSVSTRSNGYFDVSVSLSGTGTGVTNEGIRSYLQSYVMPYFTRYGYYDNRYYNGRWYGDYNYYDSSLIDEFRRTYNRYPTASEYRDVYYRKYSVSLPSDYDYNYYYNYNYNGYWRDGYWRDGYYGFSGVYFTVYDNTNNRTYNYFGSTGGSVSTR